MKPLIAIVLLFCMLTIALSSCEKDTAQPAKNVLPQYTLNDTSKVLPLSVINTNAYPINYLQMGNYWIYDCQTEYYNGLTPARFTSVYTDSVVVNGYRINSHGDTLYAVSHYRTDDATVLTEYMQMTADGTLKNEWGEVLYYFSTLPEVSDLNQHRKGCGQWTWEPFHWCDTTLTYQVGKYSFPAGLYVSDGSTDFCGPGGRKSYTLVRGIGAVNYEEKTCAPVYECNSTKRELIRFKLAH